MCSAKSELTELCKLAITFEGCDRHPHYGGHSYTPFYSKLFEGRNPKKILEVGIDTGRGLRMWRTYFPQAEIFGLDGNPALLFNEDRIQTYFCELADPSSIQAAAAWVGGNIDIAFDDGSHLPYHQIELAKAFVPLLSPGGIYIIEDVGYPITVEAGLAAFNPQVQTFDYQPNKRTLDDDRLVVIHAPA